MDCADIRERLSAYIEGIVSVEERRLIDEHLMSCQKCSESLTDLRNTLEYVKNLEEIEPPEWLTQKIMTKVKAEEKSKKGIVRRLFYPLHIKLPMEAAATVLIAVAAIYIFNAIQPEMKSETNIELGEAPPKKVEPQVPAETRSKGNMIPPSAPSQKEGKEEFKIETNTREGVIAADEVRKQSPEMGVSSSTEKQGEVASSEHMPESYQRKEFSFKKEKTPAIGEGKPAPAKPVEREVISRESRDRGKFGGAPEAPAAGEKRDMVAKSGAVEEDKSKTKLMSHARESEKSIGKKTKSVTLSWTAKHIENAEQIADENIRLLGGKIIRVETCDAGRILVTELNHKELGKLIKKLRLIGEIKESELTLEGLEGEITVRIEIFGE